MTPRKRKAEGQAADEAPAVVLEKRVTRASIKRAQVAVESEPVKKEVKARKKGGKKKAQVADMVENGKEMEVVAEEGVNCGPVTTGRTVVIEHRKQPNSFKTRAIQVKNGLKKGIPGIAVEINPENPRRGCFEIRDEGGEKSLLYWSVYLRVRFGIMATLLLVEDVKITSLHWKDEDMKQPFGPMKALDIEKVIVDIIDKIKA